VLQVAVKCQAPKAVAPWCWTKPAKPDFTVEDANGGINWAFCKLPGPDGTVMIKYKITIITANIKGAGAVG